MAEIIRTNSTTYYNASLFFPKHIRDDVFTLYAFFRTADDFVDSETPDRYGFDQFCEHYFRGDSTNSVIDAFLDLEVTYQFDKAWTVAFLQAMRMDFEKKIYHTIDETIEYMYGSAEVIGLYMAKLLALPEESYMAAQMQGRAMQIANMIRDISEDYALGRQYIPTEDLDRFGLPSLDFKTVQNNTDAFAQLIQFEIERYLQWQHEAAQGYKDIPRRLLIPIKTASEMYTWTLQTIAKNPLLIYQQKVKPSTWRVWTYAAAHILGY